MRKSHLNPVYCSTMKRRTFSTRSVVKSQIHPCSLFSVCLYLAARIQCVAIIFTTPPPLVSGEQLLHHSSSSMSRCGCVQSKREFAAGRKVTLFKQTEEGRKWQLVINRQWTLNCKNKPFIKNQKVFKVLVENVLPPSWGLQRGCTSRLYSSPVLYRILQTLQ